MHRQTETITERALRQVPLLVAEIGATLPQDDAQPLSTAAATDRLIRDLFGDDAAQAKDGE